MPKRHPGFETLLSCILEIYLIPSPDFLTCKIRITQRGGMVPGTATRTEDTWHGSARDAEAWSRLSDLSDKGRGECTQKADRAFAGVNVASLCCSLGWGCTCPPYERDPLHPQGAAPFLWGYSASGVSSRDQEPFLVRYVSSSQSVVPGTPRGPDSVSGESSGAPSLPRGCPGCAGAISAKGEGSVSLCLSHVCFHVEHGTYPQIEPTLTEKEKETTSGLHHS